MTRHGSVGDWLAWLEATGLGVAMRQWLWLYLIVEIVHIAGIVVLVGAAAMFDLRLLGRVAPASREHDGRAPAALGPRCASRCRADTNDDVRRSRDRDGRNPAFHLKLLLVAAALTNANPFHHWGAAGFACVRL